MQLVLLSKPGIASSRDFLDWMRIIGVGIPELIQEAASEPQADGLLRTAAAWLATDLATACMAAADRLEGTPTEFQELAVPYPDRLAEMARILRIGTSVFGSASVEREFVCRSIRSRLSRERMNVPPEWDNLPADAVGRNWG